VSLAGTSRAVLSRTPSPQQSFTSPAAHREAEAPSAAGFTPAWPLPFGRATPSREPFPCADRFEEPLALAALPDALGGVLALAGTFSFCSFSVPNRASMAPMMHSLITSGGRPYSAPWNG